MRTMHQHKNTNHYTRAWPEQVSVRKAVNLKMLPSTAAEHAQQNDHKEMRQERRVARNGSSCRQLRHRI